LEDLQSLILASEAGKRGKGVGVGGLLGLLGPAAQVVGSELSSSNLFETRLCVIRMEPALGVRLSLERAGCHDDGEEDTLGTLGGGEDKWIIPREGGKSPTDLLHQALSQLGAPDLVSDSIEVLSGMVRRLLEEVDCDLDARSSEDGVTPLLRALEIRGDQGSDILLLLLSQGADPRIHGVGSDGDALYPIELGLSLLIRASSVDSTQRDAMMRNLLGLIGCGALTDEAAMRGPLGANLMRLAVTCGQPELLDAMMQYGLGIYGGGVLVEVLEEIGVISRQDEPGTIGARAIFLEEAALEITRMYPRNEIEGPVSLELLRIASLSGRESLVRVMLECGVDASNAGIAHDIVAQLWALQANNDPEREVSMLCGALSTSKIPMITSRGHSELHAGLRGSLEALLDGGVGCNYRGRPHGHGCQCGDILLLQVLTLTLTPNPEWTSSSHRASSLRVKGNISPVESYSRES